MLDVRWYDDESVPTAHRLRPLTVTSRTVSSASLTNFWSFTR